MFSERKHPFPKTSETCLMLLEEVKSAMNTATPFQQARANDLIEMLRKNKCKKALLWVYQNSKTYPTPFHQQLAKKALEYAKSL